jgi:hypothetical protein
MSARLPDEATTTKCRRDGPEAALMTHVVHRNIVSPSSHAGTKEYRLPLP